MINFYKKISIYDIIITIFRSLFQKKVVELNLSFIEALQEGLQYKGVLDKIRKRPALFEPVFVCSATSLSKWTEDSFNDLLRPDYNEQDRKKMVEVDTFQLFHECIEEFFNDGIWLFEKNSKNS